MKKSVYCSLLIILLGLFAYSAYRVGGYLLEKRRSEEMAATAAQFVHTPKPEPKPLELPEEEEQPLEVDFDALRQLNGDVVAWIYVPGTQINYPVVQGSDNDYYLYRLLDGTWNDNGTLFLDYRCSADFSDENSIIYGHHMRSGTMFAALTKYKDQSFYDEHPSLYLTTPAQKYRVDLFAGCVVEADADIYQTEISPEYLAACVGRSTFRPNHEIAAEGPILTLSTCSFEFEDARYVVLGVLAPVS